MMKDVEIEYLKVNTRYHLERKLLSVLKKENLQSIIDNKLKEEKYYKDNLVQYMKKLVSSSGYSSFDELQKQFYEGVIYIIAGGKELESTSKTIKDLKYLFDLKFTSKNITQEKNYITRDLIDRIKGIDIKNVIFQYSGLEGNGNNMLKCPLHSDNKSSLKIYTQTNSFNCFGCDGGGTTIEFTAKLFNLTNKEAIQKLKQDFLF